MDPTALLVIQIKEKSHPENQVHVSFFLAQDFELLLSCPLLSEKRLEGLRA